MNEPYLPDADFIVMVANGDIPLFGSLMADHNLKLLIAFTRDEVVSNRDWATMVLAGHGPDTAEVKAALLSATHDPDPCVRGEALQGLSERDRECALPLMRRELMREECAYATFQAAASVADPSLLEGLRAWTGRGGVTWINDTIEDAIVACEEAENANT